jgi:pimeloyl-ACP methyl ester carboxylesterase
MQRRDLIAGMLAALALAACAPASAAPPFQPTRFTVEVRGQGPDVVLIPGLTAGPEVWAGTVTSVPGYRYHLIHVGGMAGAPARGNARGPVVAPLAEELGRYVATLDRPALIGHSMGGTLAMMVAARTPSRVGRVMVVDMLPQPAGLLGSSANRVGGLADSLRDIAATPGGRRLLGSLMSSFATDRNSDPDVVARAMHDLSSVDLSADLARLAAPLTVVYASSDPRTATATESSYRTAYAPARGATLVRIDRSGHMIMYDQPARLHAAIREFLRR